MSSNQQRIFPAHVMNWFSKVCFTNLVKLIWILKCPKLNSSIPTSRYYDCCVVLMKHVKIFNRLRMSSYVNHLVALEIPFLDIVVSASQQNSNLIDAPYSTKNWTATCVSLKHYLTLNLISTTHGRNLSLINDHISVPKTCK